MFVENADQNTTTDIYQMDTMFLLPIEFGVHPDHEIEILAEKFSSTTPWADRQTAARDLGRLQSPEVLPLLFAQLLNDPFWMVRCTIIQVVESIGDRRAIPVLQAIATNDEFKAVRSAALRAIERLSQ